MSPFTLKTSYKCIKPFKHTVRFIIFSVITNIHNKKTKGPTLTELFTATGKLKRVIFFTNRDVRCVPCHPWCTHQTSLVVNSIFSFPVAVSSSIKVRPLVFLL
jgi:hypothetical protein